VSTRAARRILAFVGIAALVALPFVGRWLRRVPENCCALDGAQVEPIYRVRFEDADGGSQEFCCIRCAELWLERQPHAPQTIFVTDEASGEMTDAGAAYFVRSLVVTTATTGNRIHAFRNRADAERHAQVCHGTMLNANDMPFAAVRAVRAQGE
jgi:hypothetical protein